MLLTFTAAGHPSRSEHIRCDRTAWSRLMTSRWCNHTDTFVRLFLPWSYFTVTVPDVWGRVIASCYSASSRKLHFPEEASFHLFWRYFARHLVMFACDWLSCFRAMRSTMLRVYLSPHAAIYIPLQPDPFSLFLIKYDESCVLEACNMNFQLYLR